MSMVPARFLTSLRVEDIDGRTMRLLEELKFYSAELRMVVKTEAGYVTDFASIPQFFWRVIPKNGKYDRAAVLHDAAYEGQLRDVTGAIFPATKAQADNLFKEAMAVDGVPTFQRDAMYYAVSVFGKGNWGKKATEVKT